MTFVFNANVERLSASQSDLEPASRVGFVLVGFLVGLKNLHCGVGNAAIGRISDEISGKHDRADDNSHCVVCEYLLVQSLVSNG